MSESPNYICTGCDFKTKSKAEADAHICEWERKDQAAKQSIVDQLDKSLSDEIEQRDYWESQATRLANLVGSHFGFDVGEHSNTNCPVMNAIEYLEEHENGA